MKHDTMSGYKRPGGAFEAAAHYLSYRLRSRQEVENYLKRKNYSDEEINSAISRLQEMGYIDDYKFAQEWIYFRQQKGIGSVRLQWELNQKGVSQQIITTTLQSLVNEKQEERAAGQLLHKYIQRLRTRQQAHAIMLQKAGAYLERRGFPRHIIWRLLDDKFDSTT